MALFTHASFNTCPVQLPPSPTSPEVLVNPPSHPLANTGHAALPRAPSAVHHAPAPTPYLCRDMRGLAGRVWLWRGGTVVTGL